MTEQTQPTDAEIETLGHRMCWRYKHDTGVNHISTFTFNAQTLHDFTRAVLAKWGTPAGVGEVVGWMWQHEETGRTGFVDCWQVENGWQENNPRLRLASKLFTTPQPTQAQAGAVPLTVSQIREWWASENGLEDCEMCKITDFLRVVRAVEEKHGIKGANHG